MRLWQKVALLVAIPVVCQIGFVTYLYNVAAEAGLEARRANRARELVTHLSALLKIIVDANADIVDKGWNDFVRKQNQLRARFAGELSILDRMTAAIASERQSLMRIETQIAAGLECLALADPLVRLSEFEKAREYRQQLRTINESLCSEIEKAIEQEREIAETSPAIQAENMARLQQLLIAGSSANLIITLLLALLFNRSTATRFAQLMDNTARFAKALPLHPRLEGHDEITELDSVFHKMTAALEESARREKEQHLELDRLKQDFLMMVSHDLMTPLTAVKNFLEMQSTGAYEIDESGKRLLPSLLESLERLETLVNRLIDLNRFESGQMTLLLTDVKISRVLDQVEAAVSYLAEKNAVDVILPDTNAVLIGDADRLVQVLVNLTANAIKFSPPQSQVVLSVLESSEWIEIRVKDQGRGIPRDMQKTIFDRFRQVAVSDALEKGGKGLGLAISRAIVESHGGSIGVESEVAVGSTFWIKLPRKPDQRAT